MTDSRKRISIISIIVYVLVYYLAFFDVEEMLVVRYYEGMYHMNIWDKFTMIMFWVGISFAIELKLYQYLNEMNGRISTWKCACMNVAQLVFIALSIYMGIENISVVEIFDRRKMTINFFCCVLIVLMSVQAVLWLCKICAYIKGSKRTERVASATENINAEGSGTENTDTEDEKSTTYKILLASLKLSVGMYLIISIFVNLNPIMVALSVIFGAVAVYIPVKLFLRNILEDLVQKKKYIYAIISIIIYVITFNNVYRHLLDRYMYQGNFDTIWINAIMEIVNIVFGCIAIIHIFVVYRRNLRDDELAEGVVAKNNIKQWKYLIAYLAFILLVVPVKGEVNKNNDYTYKGLCYEIVYQNVHEYEEPEEVSGIEVKLFGNVIYELQSE